MITKEQFLKYYSVQKSGKYNMFFETKEYIDAIGCTLEEIFDIMSNYAKYYDLYIKSPMMENIKEDSSEPTTDVNQLQEHDHSGVIKYKIEHIDCKRRYRLSFDTPIGTGDVEYESDNGDVTPDTLIKVSYELQGLAWSEGRRRAIIENFGIPNKKIRDLSKYVTGIESFCLSLNYGNNYSIGVGYKIRYAQDIITILENEWASASELHTFLENFWDMNIFDGLGDDSGWQLGDLLEDNVDLYIEVHENHWEKFNVRILQEGKLVEEFKINKRP